MKKLIKLITLAILVGFASSMANAQLRLPESPKFEKKAKKRTHRKFLFEIQPALSFASETERSDEGWLLYDIDYDLSVTGGSISFLPILTDKILSSDSSLSLEGRLRFTTGFWHFGPNARNLIPLEGGLDIGIAYSLSEAYKIIPYAGFQYGIAFSIGKGPRNTANRMHTLRFGIDFEMITGMRFGVSFVVNRVLFNYETNHYKISDKFKYNQIALNVAI